MVTLNREKRMKVVGGSMVIRVTSGLLWLLCVCVCFKYIFDHLVMESKEKAKKLLFCRNYQEVRRSDRLGPSTVRTDDDSV